MNLIMLEAQNFLSFPEIKLTLEATGLCLISGRNLDENDSNGAGKSTIMSAVLWALFGKTLSGLQADAVLSWTDPEDCYVRIWVVVHGKNVQVTRYRNYGPEKSNEIEVIIDGETHRGKLREMQQLINDLLGFDYSTLTTTAVYIRTPPSSLPELLTLIEGMLFPNSLILSDITERTTLLRKRLEKQNINVKTIERLLKLRLS